MNVAIFTDNDFDKINGVSALFAYASAADRRQGRSGEGRSVIARSIRRCLRYAAPHSEMRVAARQYASTRTWELAMRPLYRTYFDAHMRGATATPTDAVQVAAHGM